MKQVLSIKNLKFASLNNKYNKNKYTGKLFLTKSYREFKDLIILCAKKGFIKPPYRMMIRAETALDYDNILKPISDGLEVAGVIDNDKNINEIFIFKKSIKRGQAGSLKVFIETMEEV